MAVDGTSPWSGSLTVYRDHDPLFTLYGCDPKEEALSTYAIEFADTTLMTPERTAQLHHVQASIQAQATTKLDELTINLDPDKPDNK
jgi:hypothetical protein